jgi:hypothetical protein
MMEYEWDEPRGNVDEKTLIQKFSCAKSALRKQLFAPNISIRPALSAEFMAIKVLSRALDFLEREDEGIRNNNKCEMLHSERFSSAQWGFLDI